MGTISIKDATGANQTAALVASTGQAAAVDSLPVVLPATQAVNLSLSRQAMLSAVTTTSASSAVADGGRSPSFDASVTGTGAVAATVQIQARNTASGAWITLGTITLSGTTSAADGFGMLTRYMEYRANLTAISGTGAAVTVTMGV